jgi:hypothetical protein
VGLALPPAERDRGEQRLRDDEEHEEERGGERGCLGGRHHGLACPGRRPRPIPLLAPRVSASRTRSGAAHEQIAQRS